jgi:hypothetical protein
MEIFFQDTLKFTNLFTLEEMALAEAWLRAIKFVAPARVKQTA